IATNYGDHTLSVLLGAPGGGFKSPETLATDLLPVQTVVADVNSDGRPDLVTASNHDSELGVLVGNGVGGFQVVTSASSIELRDTPFLADFNHDGVSDSAVLDQSGSIQLREGLSGASAGFSPPLILNPNQPARDITLVRTGTTLAIAAADTQFDPALSTQRFVFDIS